MVLKRLLLFILSFGFISKASAFELTPEYVFFAPVEQDELDDPSLTDSEYPSDILAFSRSSSQDYHFFKDDKQFLLSMGSIGSKNFMINDHIKLTQFLTDQLEFRFHYWKEQDFDRDLQGQVVELNYWLTDKWALGVFGEGTFKKSEIDFGVAAHFRPHPEHEIRVFSTFPDTVRNERNKQTDTFSRPPGAMGLVGRWVSGDSEEFFQYSLREEKPTHWDFPDQGYRYKFRRQTAGLYSRTEFSGDFLTLRWQGDKKVEDKQWTTASSSLTSPVRMERERHMVLLEWEDVDLFEDPGKAFRYGLYVTHREYDNGSGEVTQSTVLPHFWYRAPAGKTGGIRDYWILGADTSLFRETGDNALLNRPIEEGVTSEFRLTTSYDFQMKNQASLKLIFTFDLDEFGSGSTWEGGAGVFQMPF